MTDDEVTGCTLKLYYTVFEDCDVISRYSVLENHGKAPVDIEKMMSLTCDIPGREWDMISLHGAHCWERNVCRLPVRMGSQSVFSRRGASSHQFNPFIAIAERKATEERGSVYGFNFVYSGNFLSEVEQGQEEYTRVQVGIGSENFGWRLEPGEVFEAPEAVMTYSASGIGQMSRNFHKFTRAHILPPDKTEHRPVVLNSWEAVFFDIDEKVLIDFARGEPQIRNRYARHGRRLVRQESERPRRARRLVRKPRTLPRRIKGVCRTCEGGGRRLRNLD